MYPETWRSWIAVLLMSLGVGGCGDPSVTHPGSADGGGNGGGGASPDGGASAAPGWSAQHDLGPQRDGLVVDIYALDVALNDLGEGVIAWDESSDNSGGVWSNRVRQGTWEGPVRLSEVGVEAGTPSVANNASNAAVVAWEVLSRAPDGLSDTRTIWARRWNGTDWSAAEQVSELPAAGTSTEARSPKAGLDDSGRAFLAWYQLGDGHGVYGSIHDGSAWSAPVRLNEGTLAVAEPDLAASANGIAVVVWRQDTNPYDPNAPGGGPRVANIWARSWSEGTWNPPQRIGSELVDSEFAERPSVAAGASGEAMAIWEERRLDSIRIAAARFDPAAKAWEAPTPLASATNVGSRLRYGSIAIDGAGNGLATWTHGDSGSSTEDGLAAYFSRTSKTWSAPSAFEPQSSIHATRAVMSTEGHAWAIFTRPDDNGFAELMARHYAQGAWADPIRLGNGEVHAAAGSATGAILVGSVRRFYSSKQPMLRTVGAANFYLP